MSKSFTKSRDTKALERKAEAFAAEFGARKHHVKVHGPHAANTLKCHKCFVDHYPSQHKSHGVGSYKRAHKKGKRN